MRKSVGKAAGSVLAIAALGLTLGCAGPAVAQSDEELVAAALDAVLKNILGGPYPIAGRVRLEAYFVSRPDGSEPVLCGVGRVHGVYPITFVSGRTPETTISWTGSAYLFSSRWVEQCLPGRDAEARNRSWLAIAER
jgi:hypothetical protein